MSLVLSILSIYRLMNKRSFLHNWLNMSLWNTVMIIKGFFVIILQFVVPESLEMLCFLSMFPFTLFCWALQSVIYPSFLCFRLHHHHSLLLPLKVQAHRPQAPPHATPYLLPVQLSDPAPPSSGIISSTTPPPLRRSSCFKTP